MITERRQHPRVAIPLDAAFHDASGWGRRNVRIVDIGLGGCFIDAMSAPTVGSALTIELQAAGRTLTLPAEVVYVDRIQGFAVRFTAMPPEVVRALTDVLGALHAQRTA